MLETAWKLLSGCCQERASREGSSAISRSGDLPRETGTVQLASHALLVQPGVGLLFLAEIDRNAN
jgi:hypothetical protein